MKGKDRFIIVPIGEKCASWLSLQEILRMWENQSKSPPILGEFFNPPVWGPEQTHWVRPPEHQLNSVTNLWKKVLICDV